MVVDEDVDCGQLILGIELMIYRHKSFQKIRDDSSSWVEHVSKTRAIPFIGVSAGACDILEVVKFYVNDYNNNNYLIK